MASLQEKFNALKETIATEREEVKAAIDAQAEALATQEVKIAELLTLVEELKAQVAGGGEAITEAQIDEVITSVKDIHQVAV